MNTHNVNTAARESSERWGKDLRAFIYQELGRFNVRYTSHSALGDFYAHHSAQIFALNKYDAVYKFGRDTVKGGKFDVYRVDTLEPVQDVCISTTDYHFTVDGDLWRCLENGEFVEVTRDGDIWDADRMEVLPLYGHLQQHHC